MSIRRRACLFRLRVSSPFGGEKSNMQRIRLALARLIWTGDGQDLLEYALVVTLIAIAAAIAVGSVGNTVSGTLWRVIADTNF